jgi:hypothetical protein
MYPNPVTDHLTIEIEGEVTGFVRIYNLAGILVASSKTQKGTGNMTFKIDVNQLPTGIYFVRIGSSSGKFVKQY